MTYETRWQATERKFLVSPETAEAIADWARTHLEPDPWASDETGDGYYITTLYFDNPEFGLFKKHGSHGRAKYRVRRYGSSEDVFLERKLKNDRMLAKRRCVVPLTEVISVYNSGIADSPWIGRWFRRRLAARRFVPVCRISTHRMARVLPVEGGLIRLTLDYNVRAVRASGIDFGDLGTATPLLDRQIIVEMKYRGEMPAVLCEAVEKFGLIAAPVSKYRLAVKALGLVPEDPMVPSLITQEFEESVA